MNEVAFVGKGTQNGFLLRLLVDQFSGVGVTAVPIGQVASEAYEAVGAALVACLTLDGVESNLPAVTGASGARLLGLLVPGSARNWRRCVEWLYRAAAPAKLKAA